MNKETDEEEDEKPKKKYERPKMFILQNIEFLFFMLSNCLMH